MEIKNHSIQLLVMLLFEDFYAQNNDKENEEYKERLSSVAHNFFTLKLFYITEKKGFANR